MKTILELTNVEKIYLSLSGEKFYALSNINLSIAQGEFISVMGPSGSGKTTLANLIGLLSKPSDGSLVFLDQRCDQMSDRELTQYRGQYIGFIFQDYMLIEHMNALQNVMLSMHLEKLSSRKIKLKAIEMLSHVGLSEHIYKLPRQLSGGQKQRVAIARALVKNPAIILADEPAGALDPTSRSDILSLLQNLNSQGSTIFMVTHNKEDASAGTRLLEIQNSQIVSDYNITERTYFKYSGLEKSS